MENLIAQIIGGALGGVGGGKAVKGGDMGNIGNLIAGALGGLGGGSLLGGLMGGGAEVAADAAAAGGLDIAALAGNLVGGGIGGVIVQVVVGMVLKRMRG
jgi:hypothetical protein